ncbi:MAG TPA: hypothetical protein VMN36_03910 [Verrucomicrobiales bacterium]|nr:hypothetical protein [Verrucomicrobiales bacterium]
MQRFHSKEVSASEDGDYFQIAFEEFAESEDRPYLIVQRQFEDPDGDVCYVETDDWEHSGHSRIRSARLERGRFVIEWSGSPEAAADVSFDIDDEAFAEVARVLMIMVPTVRIEHGQKC